jgi:hypothetical protein
MLGAPNLGSIMSDRRVWAAAFLLVLAAGQLAVGMRASRTATVTGDEPFYLLTAESLVSDGDLDLRDEYADADREMARFWDGTKPLWKQMEPAPDGRLLSPHDPGLSLLIAPAYAVAGLEGVRRFLVVVWAAAMGFAAACARRAGAPPWAAVLAAFAVGAGAPGIVYASQIYPEGPAALCLAVGLLCALRPASRPQRSQDAVVVATAVVALEWLGVKYLPYAVLLVGVWAWRNREHRRALVVAGAIGAITAAHFVWWHLATFGGLTPYATNIVFSGDGTARILTRHLGIPDRSYRLYGLFLDARFGLFRWLPAAPLALWGIAKRTWHHSANLAIAVLLGTFMSITMMGYWFPGRMLVAALPSLVVLLAFGAARLPKVAVTLTAWSLAIATAVVVAAHTRVIRLAVDPWTVGFPLAPHWLFPDFRSFGVREVAVSLAWGSALLAARVLVRSGLIRGRRRERQSAEVLWPRAADT